MEKNYYNDDLERASFWRSLNMIDLVNTVRHLRFLRGLARMKALGSIENAEKAHIISSWSGMIVDPNYDELPMRKL